jgi:hypothetical protein
MGTLHQRKREAYGPLAEASTENQALGVALAARMGKMAGKKLMNATGEAE